MGLYRVIGNRIISEAEVAEKRSQGAFRKLESALRARSAEGMMEFMGGGIAIADIAGFGALPPGSNQVSLEPTGVGKPCLVKFETVYSGKHGGGLFGSRKDMLVTSAMKSLHISTAQARAVNYLESKMGARRVRHLPTPTMPGRPVIFYAPSLVSMSAAVKFEMAFDDIDEEDFDKVAQVLQGMGQLPMFMPYSGFFWLAGQLVNIVKEIGSAIFDGEAEFDAEDTFDLTPIVGQPFAADLRFYMNERDWQQLEGKYLIRNGVLVDQSGAPYDGDAPYLLISISGQRVPELDGFTPEAIGADIAAKFYSSTKRSTVLLDVLSKSVGLWSEWQYWQDAQRYEAERAAAMAKTPPDQAAADAAKAKRDAAIANIKNADFKKLLPPMP
jgi:hypothetical protein